MSISLKIRKQLEQPNGLTQEALEPLAADYSQLARSVNVRLSECVGYLRKGLRSEALQRANMKPGVLDLAADLDFPELEEWIEILQFYGIEPPQVVDRDATAQLHEAFVDEQPLEELLKQHRRLAIAKAPLAWRLKVLRQIASADPMNAVWQEDIVQWEAYRLKQIASDWVRMAADPNASDDLRKLSEELNGAWLVQPPSELKQKIHAESERRVFQSQLASLRATANELHDAYAAGDSATGEAVLKRWKSTLQSMKQSPPNELVEDAAPAIEWVEERMREQALSAQHETFSMKLEQLLQSGTTNEGELSRAYHDVVGLQLGIDSLLENRLRTRLSELQQSSQRRLVISVVGIVAAALAVMIGGGLWYWNHNYRLAVSNTGSQLQALLANEQFGEAESILKMLDTQSPSVAQAPEIAALKSTLVTKQAEEQKRIEAFAVLIAEANAPEPQALDSSRILAAEKAAKTDQEKQAAARLRAKLEQYQQKLANDDFQALRVVLQGLESRLERLQQLPMAEVTDADVETLISEIKGLTSKFPKAMTQGAKLVDLSNQRAVAVRDSLRKQRREMEQKQLVMVDLRGAKSVGEHETQLRKFVDSLPSDTLSLEFKDALNESMLWKTIDDWNTWCNSLSLQISGRLPADQCTALAESCDEIRAALDGLPGEAWVPVFVAKAKLYGQREEIVSTLIEELMDSVIIDLYTLKSTLPKEAEADSAERAFIHYESYAEILADTKKVSNKTISTIPIVSDSTGGVTNEEFKGKIDIVEEPRQSLRILIRDLNSQKTAIIADWESQMLGLLGRVAQLQNVDGKIKEILFARILAAAREGSPAMKEAFVGVQDELFRTSEKRNRWFIREIYREDISDELLRLLQVARTALDVKRKEEATQLLSLSKSRVVWVGSILRDGSGTVSPAFYRDDVPDGTLFTVVAKGAQKGSGKLVRVGEVRERKGNLQASVETLLPGRPLFWIRSTGAQ